MQNDSKNNWGGSRPNSGRKEAGTKAYLIRMKPRTMGRIKAKMTKKLNTPGKVLDDKFQPKIEKE